VKPFYLMMGLLVAGCTVGPDYQQPEIALQTRFVGGNADAIGAVAAEKWWLSYKDATLSQYVTRGMGQNLDVLNAVEAIRQAQAELRQTGLSAAAEGSLTAATTKSGGDDINGTQTTDSGELGASFVIDLFGSISREREASLASLGGARAEVETVRLAWLAELLAAYSDARYYQEVLALTRDTIKARKETVDITRSQFEAGAATQYGVAEARALLSTAQASLPEFAALFDAQIYAIATLLNEPAGPILAQMQKGSPQLSPPRSPRTGVPADLLRNRPDVRSAEADLAAAVAEVGVAEAAIYPSLSLTGSVGRSENTDSWSFGPQLTFPVFNQSVLRASRDAQVSVAKQAEITWRASVLSAVEDVQVAQSNLSRYRQRANLLRKAANDYGEALSLAQQNYRNGAITLLDLLDTDRNTLTARISSASATNDAAQAWATLKIATGAGAAATTPATASQTTD